MGCACDHTGITANSVASVDWMVGFAIQPGRRAAAEQSDRVARLVHEIKKWQGGLTAIVVALLAVVMVTPVHAQVHVDIGIHFPAPPPLDIVPETPWVQYVPPEPANLFFYNGQYWAFANGGWYLGPGFNGPWIVVAPELCPGPSCSYRCGITTSRLDTGAGGKTVGPRAGMRSGDASGRKSGSGEAANMNGTTITTTIEGRGRGRD